MKKISLQTFIRVAIIHYDAKGQLSSTPIYCIYHDHSYENTSDLFTREKLYGKDYNIIGCNHSKLINDKIQP